MRTGPHAYARLRLKHICDAGHASAFLNLIRSRAPELCRSFDLAHARRGPDIETAINALYDAIPVTDISSEVLAASPEKSGVLCLGDVGWSDLGDPGRLRAAIENERA